MTDDLMNAIFTPLVIQSGLFCLSVQVSLHVLFAHVLPPGPWTKLPSFTAHQVLCFPLMLYISYQGIVTWFLDLPETFSSEERIVGVVDKGVELGEVVFGFLLFWDIPVSLMTKTLQNSLMMAHHIGMLFVSAVAMGIFCNQEPRGSYYAPFFLGVIESSTVFLCYVDIFHPRYKYWNDYMNQKKGTPLGNAMSGLNEVFRLLFALSFLGFRFFYFPYVTFTTSLPDFWATASQNSDKVLYGICILNLLFSLLQIHWGLLISQSLLKALGLTNTAPSSSKKTAKGE